jgi:predicted dehydrogenase
MAARHHQACRLLAARRNGKLTKAFQHICWDGCMFPNDVMMQAADLERHPRRHDQGPRRAWLAADQIMAKAKTLNIGMVGYGFMGRTHSNAFRQATHFFDLGYKPVLKTICARSAEKARPSRSNGATRTARPIGASWSTTRIDLIDIASPNDTHGDRHRRRPAGKMVMCEKPLGRNAESAEDGGRRREGRRAQHGLVQLPPRARRDAGQAADRRRPPRQASSTTAPSSCRTGPSRKTCRRAAGLWRLDVGVAGSGVTGDLLAHCIDTAMWLNGGIETVSAMTETFIKSAMHNLTGKTEPVGIDDASLFLARFDNGSLGLRGHALCPRPQGALHARDQRRARLDRLGPARSAPAAVLRSPRRGPHPRLALGPHHRRRSSLTWPSGGCRVCRSATSTPSSIRPPTSSRV